MNNERKFNQLFDKWKKMSEIEFPKNVDKQLEFIDKKILGYKHNNEMD